MSQPTPTTVVTTKLTTCPACHQDVSARLTLGVDVTEDELRLAVEQSTAAADVTVVAMAVSHDCNRPPTPRHDRPLRFHGTREQDLDTEGQP